MKAEFLKGRYDFELDRKDKLTAALTLPVGVLGGLGGVLVAMIRTFNYSDSLLWWVFVPSVVAAAGAFIACLATLWPAYYRQEYSYLPLLRELEDWETEFRDFNRYVENTGGDIEETFSDHLRERIIVAADKNTLSNDERSKFLHWSRAALFWLLCFGTVAGIAYIADQVRFSMAKPQGSTQGSTTTQTRTQSGSTKPPAFPQNRIIKEGSSGSNVKK